MRQLILAASIVSLVSCASQSHTPPNAETHQVSQQTSLTESFHTLANTVWEDLSASHKTALPDMSPAALNARYQKHAKWLAQLDAIDVSQLSSQDRINHAMISYSLKNSVDEYRFKAHYMPLTAEGSFHSSLAFMPGNTRFESTQDYRDYLSKLATIQRYMTQQTNWLRKAIEEVASETCIAFIATNR